MNVSDALGLIAASVSMIGLQFALLRWMLTGFRDEMLKIKDDFEKHMRQIPIDYVRSNVCEKSMQSLRERMPHDVIRRKEFEQSISQLYSRINKIDANK